MPDQKQQLVIVVAGKPVTLEANVNAPLHSIIGKALEISGNSGQPPESWELRTENGQLLDPARKIGDFGFGSGTKLFLNQKVGVGG